MQHQTTSQQTASSAPFDFKALRMPATYGETLGVKKLLTKVPVGKPGRADFFRVHTDESMTFTAMLLEQKELIIEFYIVHQDVAYELKNLVRPYKLHAAIDRQNNIFLIPVPLPGEDGNRNQWHESRAQAVESAKTNWVRISANMYKHNYDVFIAEGALSEPEWPEHDIDKLAEVAFRGRVISSLDHPIVQSLMGRI